MTKEVSGDASVFEVEPAIPANPAVAISWTRAEALACAYCWCEFSKPESRPDSPEAYWLGVTERTRMECRKIVKARHLLAVAMRQAAALFPPNNLTDEQVDRVREAIGLKARHRVWQTLQGIYRTFLPPDWSQDDRVSIAAIMARQASPLTGPVSDRTANNTDAYPNKTEDGR